ncbi:MAG: hypothetical protein IID46_13780 [Planctomycetes bacterium]|nr:hypothetical protein [Planctomycetota bacterium]
MDDLDKLGDLIHDLKQGGLNTGHSKPASSGHSQPSASNPAASNRSEVPSHPNQQAEKKTPDSEKESSESRPRIENQTASIPFKTECEDELWSQVLLRINDASSTHLKNASIAITGPNRLEISFPTSYHFSKQYCERPEILGRLERIVAEITSQPVSISMKLSGPAQNEQARQDDSTELVSDETGVAGSDSSKSTVESATQTLGSENDPFVKQAEEVFGGTTIKVEEISTSLPQSE